MVILIIVSILILSAISYLAISRRSDNKVRFASLGALAVMIITVIVCLFKIIMTPAAAQVQAYPDMPVSELPPAAPNTTALVLFIVILLALFISILLLSLREQRKTNHLNSA
jgi:cytochrome bd-type quinol oxidase subunit 2